MYRNERPSGCDGHEKLPAKLTRRLAHLRACRSGSAPSSRPLPLAAARSPVGGWRHPTRRRISPARRGQMSSRRAEGSGRADRHGRDPGGAGTLRGIRDGHRGGRSTPRRARPRGRRLLPRRATPRGPTWACNGSRCPRCAALLETLSHTALSVAHLVTTGPTSHSSSTPPTHPCCRCSARRASRSRSTSTGWSGSGRSGVRPAAATTSPTSGSPCAGPTTWSPTPIGTRGLLPGARTAHTRPSSRTARRSSRTSTRSRLGELGLAPGEYHLVVARMEPENHVDVIVDGYVRSSATLPLVVVGSVALPERARARGARLRGPGDPRVRMLGGVWDQELLDSLYAGAASYLHGHSVGGTNPSLLRAMGAGAAVVAWDVQLQPGGARGHGRFFSTPDDVAREVGRAGVRPGGGPGLGRASAGRRRSPTGGTTSPRLRAAVRAARGADRPVVTAVADGPSIQAAGRVAMAHRRDLAGVHGHLRATRRPTSTGPTCSSSRACRPWWTRRAGGRRRCPSDGPLVALVRERGGEVEILDFPVAAPGDAVGRRLREAGLVRRRGGAPADRVPARTRPDVVYVNTVTLPWWLLAARLTRTPSVCHVHEAENG